MATLNTPVDSRETASHPGSSHESRISRLEERSQHAATKADLYRAVIALAVMLGGLIIHLHNVQMALIEKLAGG